MKHGALICSILNVGDQYTIDREPVIKFSPIVVIIAQFRDSQD